MNLFDGRQEVQIDPTWEAEELRWGDREVKIQYVVGEDKDFNGHPAIKIAQVYCYHNKERKMFIASFRFLHRRDNVESFMLYAKDAYTVAVEPVARYSNSAFETFVERVQKSAIVVTEEASA